MTRRKESLLYNLQDLFSNAIYRIPDYQRGYSWQDEQREEFWSDLICLPKGKDHYTGMISLKTVKPEEIEKDGGQWESVRWLLPQNFEIFEVVDGQQRLTTLSILLKVIFDYCDERGIETIDGVMRNSALKQKYILQTSEVDDIKKAYLFGYEKDNPSDAYYRKMILGDIDESEEPYETFYTENLRKAEEFFKEKIEKLSRQEVADIYEKITRHLRFNIHDIEDDFNVFVAFETMNNRGKQLSHLELLKNRLIYLTTLFECDSADEQVRREFDSVCKDYRRMINTTWQEIYGYLGRDKNRLLSDEDFLQDHWKIYFGYNTRSIVGQKKRKTISYDKYLLKKFFIQQNIDPNSSYNPDAVLAQDEGEEGEYEPDSESEEVKKEVEQLQPTEKINLTLETIKDYVRSLKSCVSHWYHVQNPADWKIADTDEKGEELRWRLMRLSYLGQVNATPLLTVLLSRDDISIDDKIQCVKNIERFNFLNYRLNEYRTTAYNSTFYNMARDLYRGEIGIEKVLRETERIDFLDENLVINTNGVYEKFRKLTEHRDGFYSWGSALKCVLFLHDQKLAHTKVQEISPDEFFKTNDKDKTSIEHIYPQKAVAEEWPTFKKYNHHFLTDEQKRWLIGSLGNLLPLSLEINISAQNNPFSEKKVRYATSSISAINISNNFLEEKEKDGFDDWAPEVILERGLKITRFMEEEYRFKFRTERDRYRFLGLEFMYQEGEQGTAGDSRE